MKCDNCRQDFPWDLSGRFCSPECEAEWEAGRIEYERERLHENDDEERKIREEE